MQTAQVVVATKVRFRVSDPGGEGLSPELMISAEERARLEAHAPPPEIHPQRMLREQAGIDDPAELRRPSSGRGHARMKVGPGSSHLEQCRHGG